MKKIVDNEITRGVLIALLGVDMFITICLGSYLFERCRQNQTLDFSCGSDIYSCTDLQIIR